MPGLDTVNHLHFFFFKNGIQATRLEEQRPGKMLQIIIASIY